MKIRKITKYSKKIDNAVCLLLPQLAPKKDHSRSKLKVILKANSTNLFIAETADKQIAAMLSLILYDIPTGRKAIIEDVVVDELHRGQGIGKLIMLHAIDFAKKSGAEYVDLTSRPSRIAANRLYFDLGFILRETNCYRYEF